MAKKLKSFEEAMARLREITERLEKGEDSLEESIELFSEGAALSAFCYETLQKAEQKLVTLDEVKEEIADE